MVAPEQRLSLQLKWHEMWAKGEEDVCTALEDISSMPYQDFLDESDELLHHRYLQLCWLCAIMHTSLRCGGEEIAIARKNSLSLPHNMPCFVSESLFWVLQARGH